MGSNLKFLVLKTGSLKKGKHNRDRRRTWRVVDGISETPKSLCVHGITMKDSTVEIEASFGVSMTGFFAVDDSLYACTMVLPC